MSDKKPLNIGLVGYGFMGRTHSNGYKRVNDFFGDLPIAPYKAICGRNSERTEAFASQWGYESTESNWKALIAEDDIDAIESAHPMTVTLPSRSQPQKREKWFFAKNLWRVQPKSLFPWLRPLKKQALPTPSGHNYRRIPAVTLAKQIIDSGKLGKVFHYRANFLQDWTISEELPQGGEGLWRLDAAAAGSGVTGDLLAHCIDTAIWLNGGIQDVSAVTETFIKERVHTATGEKQAVTIDDVCIFHCHFNNGSLGLFESTRYARGHKALYTLEINGENASIRWDLHDLNRLEFFDHSDEGKVRGWRSIHITDGDHPYLDKWWVPGLCIGYEHTFVHR